MVLNVPFVPPLPGIFSGGSYGNRAPAASRRIVIRKFWMALAPVEDRIAGRFEDAGCVWKREATLAGVGGLKPEETFQETDCKILRLPSGVWGMRKCLCLGDYAQISVGEGEEKVAVAEETLHPTPYGWWEKAYVVGLFIGLAVAAIATVAVFLKWVDPWTYLAIAVGVPSSSS